LPTLRFFTAGGRVIQREHPEWPQAMLEVVFASDGALTPETLAIACALPIEHAGAGVGIWKSR
jgi:hypothetical protein